MGFFKSVEHAKPPEQLVCPIFLQTLGMQNSAFSQGGNKGEGGRF